MSLINDALKKAQKLQTQQPEDPAPAPMPAAQFAVRTARQPGTGMSFERMLLAVVTLVAVIVGMTAVAVLLLRREGNTIIAGPPRPGPSAPAVRQARSQATPTVPAGQPAVPPAASAAATPAITAPAAAPSPVSTAVSGAPVLSPAAAEPVPQPTITLRGANPPPVVAAVSQPAPAAAAAVFQPVPASGAHVISIDLAGPTVPAFAAPTEAMPSAAVHPGRPAAAPSQPGVPVRNAEILKFLENARVAGVRVAGDDSRVLMNDHVYRVNDVVSADLGLRLTGVGTTALAFVNENGLVYTKNF